MVHAARHEYPGAKYSSQKSSQKLHHPVLYLCWQQTLSIYVATLNEVIFWKEASSRHRKVEKENFLKRSLKFTNQLQRQKKSEYWKASARMWMCKCYSAYNTKRIENKFIIQSLQYMVMWTLNEDFFFSISFMTRKQFFFYFKLKKKVKKGEPKIYCP